MDKSKQGKRNRRAGHDYERQIAKELRHLGFINCRTSRYASKMLDDLKVDLTYTNPFNIQCKNSLRINYKETLSEMPDDHNYNVIFHKCRRKEYVIMDKASFIEI